MNVTPISAVKPINFKQKIVHDDDINTKVVEEKTTPKKVSGYTVAAALGAAVLAGGLVHGHYKGELRAAERRSKELLDSTKRHFQNEIDRITNSWDYRENKILKETNKTLNSKITALTGENSALKSINERYINQLTEIFEGDVTPKEACEKVLVQLKDKINKGELSYDISMPPVKAIDAVDNSIKVVNLPTVGTTNRAGMKELLVPEIAENGHFSFEIPTSNEVKITKVESADFQPEKNVKTSISESYADSVRWSNDKIARDILQNFYDGHGQTLDGVKMVFTPIENGKYRVRIEGKSTYTPDKAIYIGESTKRNNANAAGNYGEGLKMSVLKLLKDSGANDVKIGSDNWKVIYNLQSGNLSDKRVLTYSLDKVDNFDGNYFEFETNDKDLLNSLRKSIDRFYHSANKDFECPQFENEILGIKVLPNENRGAIYIAGQRFEFDGDFDGLKGISLFLKEKPSAKAIDVSRDRTSLHTSDLQNIADWIMRDSRISYEDKFKILKTLEKYWEKTESSFKKPMDKFIERFILILRIKFKYSDPMKIKFPDKYIAYSNASDDVVRDLQSKGYIICKEDFADLGMPTIHDVMCAGRQHDVVMPNEIEKKKIMILREAISKLSPSLKEKHFTPKELDTHIYMFDKTSPKERKLYSDCDAEAIIDNGVSKGFWIDKYYLNKIGFSEALETALHELSHKVGGDESAEFSYKLTDVNATAIRQMLEDPKVRAEITTLQKLWESLN